MHGSSFAKHASDTLRRSVGFYITPAVTGIINVEDRVKINPSFGLIFGFRFVNKLKYGFFLERGVGISWIGARYAQQDATVI